jgi:hypothetical protein
MPPGRNWPKRINGFLSRRHRVDVRFGPPIWPAEGESRTDMMHRVRSYLEGGVAAPKPPATPSEPAPAATAEPDAAEPRPVVAHPLPTLAGDSVETLLREPASPAV